MCARATKVDDPELGELTLDRLTRDIEVWQRRHGHRFSADDVVTAFIAAQAFPTAERVLDLGCGLGSVLLHLAWSLPAATLVGIEAQSVSHALVTRNIVHNRLGERVRAHLGDLRDPAHQAALEGPFDLVTGTPPYFPERHALDAADAQRAHARVEYRGGIEAYIEAGARLLAAHGRLVLCGDARAEARVTTAARAAGLEILARTDVIAREPRPPLFSVWTLAIAAAPAAAQPVVASQALALRDRHGHRTPQAEALKAFSGLV